MLRSPPASTEPPNSALQHVSSVPAGPARHRCPEGRSDEPLLPSLPSLEPTPHTEASALPWHLLWQPCRAPAALSPQPRAGVRGLTGLLLPPLQSLGVVSPAPHSARCFPSLLRKEATPTKFSVAWVCPGHAGLSQPSNVGRCDRTSSAAYTCRAPHRSLAGCSPPTSPRGDPSRACRPLRKARSPGRPSRTPRPGSPPLPCLPTASAPFRRPSSALRAGHKVPPTLCRQREGRGEGRGKCLAFTEFVRK